MTKFSSTSRSRQESRGWVGVQQEAFIHTSLDRKKAAIEVF
jgi:hypothetical protein